MEIVFIGSGNVAWHLAKFFSENAEIKQIFNINIDSAKELANILNCDFTDKISNIYSNADLYIVSVKDFAIKDIVSNLKIGKKSLIVHTSGSIDVNVFENYFENYGIIYPLQTFSKDKKLNYNEIPFFIEANSDDNLSKIKDFLSIYTDKIHIADSDKRKVLHVSAVFACNFTNFMFTIADDILKKHQLSFDVLMPLIKETVDKLNTLPPDKAQTGPAIRNDIDVINKHLDFLNDFPEYKKLYSVLSDYIRKGKTN